MLPVPQPVSSPFSKLTMSLDRLREPFCRLVAKPTVWTPRASLAIVPK
jgi:hypothetical protein